MRRTRVVRVDSEQYAEIMALREALHDAASAPDVLRTKARSRLRFLERLIADTRAELRSWTAAPQRPRCPRAACR